MNAGFPEQTMGRRIVIAVHGKAIKAVLDLAGAPESCRALLGLFPWRPQFVAARWSGPLCLVQKLAIEGLPVENPADMLVPGDIVFHPSHRDLAIAFGPTQFIERTRAVYVTLLGRVVDGLDELASIGAGLQKSGAVDCLWTADTTR